MPDRRAKRPLDPAATRSADDQIYAAHAGDPRPNPLYDADGNRTPLSATDPSQTALRREWMDYYVAAGGQLEGEPEPGRPETPVEPCPLCNLIKVEFLDGDDNTELAQDDKHWVNLPRDAKWVDTTNVRNIDRLSQKPRVKVTFDRPGSHPFKIKYVPDAANIAYSAAEKGRNTNFTYEERELEQTTNADGTKILPTEMFVTAAGKHKYKLSARDNNGNTAESHTIEQHRLVHYIEIKMTGVSAAASLGTFEGEYANHNIKMVEVPEVTIARMENIGTDADETAFQDSARAAYNGSDAPNKEPYVLAIGYTDHLAVKNAGQTVRKEGVTGGAGQPATDIPIQGAGLRAGDGVNERYLWQNIVTGESWFVSATFEPDDGSAAVDIPAAKCTAVASGGNPSMSKLVRVDVTGLPAKTGRISLTVNWVDRMRGGLAFGGGNLVCVCTRSWWTTKSSEGQNQIIIHEVGHKVSMVVKGTGRDPDRVTTQYDAKGHVGSHCHHPLAVLASYAGVDGSGCVMFGSTNGLSAFCANCAPAVKKQDISTGWTRF